MRKPIPQAFEKTTFALQPDLIIARKSAWTGQLKLRKLQSAAYRNGGSAELGLILMMRESASTDSSILIRGFNKISGRQVTFGAQDVGRSQNSPAKKRKNRLSSLNRIYRDSKLTKRRWKQQRPSELFKATISSWMARIFSPRYCQRRVDRIGTQLFTDPSLLSKAKATVFGAQMAIANVPLSRPPPKTAPPG